MRRVVLDTNVIVSALVFGGLPRQIFELIEAGHCRWFYSRDLQAEVRRVLLEKFRWREHQLDRDPVALWSLGTNVAPGSRVHAVQDDPDDDRIVECALAAEAEVIVSGDRHLLRLGAIAVCEFFLPVTFVATFLAE